MIKRTVSLALALLILSGIAPGVLASAEPEPAVEVASEDIAAPAEEMISETPVGEGEEAIVVEAFLEEPQELPLVYTLPSGEKIDVDPEDPLYWEKMGNGNLLLSAWNEIETYQSFTPRQVAGETVRPGIDVSSWQGTIRWDEVAAAGVEFAFLRGAYRGTTNGALGTDGRFEEYLQKAGSAGLKVGVYIYSQAITVEEGREEAEYLLNLLDGRHIDLPLVIDYEYYGSKGRLYNAKLTDRERTDICLAFCEVVEAAGYDAMVYGNASMLGSDLYAEELDKVWLAHYAKKTTYKGAYDFWQCSASGSISGISGNVDLNFWFDTETAESLFEDVTEADWFYDTVMAAYENGIVSGMGDGMFAPYDKALRGQVVTMLHRLMGRPAAGGSAGFTDLTADYYVEAVNWAAIQGIVHGYSETEFGPDGCITRQDLITLLHRMEGCPSSGGSLSSYTDSADVREYARDAMVWAVERGIIAGYEDNTLRPAAEATRAEVCAILMRYIDLA